uniref:NUC153 domain-containing protein n=1 Tax=Mucochytrium quahogii TaxID=96639 RepID=A0A7S2RUT6_9STRA
MTVGDFVEYGKRIELIQDFHFNTVSNRVKVANDGVHIVATGTYPPMVKVYDTRELSMKFCRYLDAEVVQFEILSDDYTKMAFLGDDRTITFHAAYGTHHMVRVPKFGRDMTYDPFGCELYIGTSSSELYRLDLEQGKFLAPFATPHEGVNVLDFNRPLQMLACGGEEGIVSCWDSRQRSMVGELDLSKDGNNVGVSALKMDHTGLMMAVGTTTGRCDIYDIRSSRPIQSKQHMNDLPIVSVDFQRPGRLIVSADPKSIRVWNRDDGSTFTNIEPQADVNDLCIVESKTGGEPRSTGLFLVAGETDRMMSFYVPRLGQAPRWASFLDNLTEELEEKDLSNEELYDNYKFVTMKDLESLGVTNLVGTALLRPYMHGYFMDMRLYNRVKAVSEPLAFEKWRKSKVKQKIEERAAQRISRKTPTNVPKVNRAYAERLEAEKSAEKSKKKKSKSPAPDKDSRFTAMFEDPEFEIDQESEQFKQNFASGFGNKTTNDDDMDSVASSGESDHEEITPLKEPLETSTTKKRRIVMKAKRDTNDEPLLEELSAKKTKRTVKRRALTLKEQLEQNKKESEIKTLPGGNMEHSFVLK